QLTQLAQAEDQLARAFGLVASRHSAQDELRATADLLAGWSAAHTERLHPHLERYGSRSTDDVRRLRAALFHGARVGGVGLLRDLGDLRVLAARASIGWTALGQAAKGIPDSELVKLCAEASEETRRQLAWLETHIKHVAPQALVPPAETLSELRASLPK